MIDDNTSENNIEQEENNNNSVELEQDNVETQEDRDADFSKLDDPNEQIAELKAIAEAEKQNYLRALADLENFKKRAAKDRSELLKYQGDKIVYDLLEVVDNLELALVQENPTAEDLSTGLNMIHKLFVDTLDKWGIKSKGAKGEAFDPQIQDALSAVVDDSVKPGHVVQELKKTYHYKDKLLRPGQVIVAKEAEEEQATENIEEN